MGAGQRARLSMGGRALARPRPEKESRATGEMRPTGGYEVRRAWPSKNSSERHAPPWAPAAAAVALSVLVEQRHKHGESEKGMIWKTLKEEGKWKEFERKVEKRASRETVNNVKEVLGYHREAAAGSTYHNKTVTRRVLDQMRERAKRKEEMEEGMPLPAPPTEKRTLKDVLSTGDGDRQRSMAKNRRIRKGIAGWNITWSDGPSVVCYERAARDARGKTGEARTAAVMGRVSSDALPTAIGNRADHYVVLGEPNGPRWASVQEVARAQEVPEHSDSPLWDALCQRELVTPTQAAELLGNAVHVGAMRALIRALIEEGVIKKGDSYASSCSGADTVAAALYEELGGDMWYEFASERDSIARKVLLSAWKESGLKEERCYLDACSREATREATVGVWAGTFECDPHSQSGSATAWEAAKAFGTIDVGLDYVRNSEPCVVIMENVPQKLLAERMEAALRNIKGYRWRHVVVEPSADLGSAQARKRAFWIGVRRG